MSLYWIIAFIPTLILATLNGAIISSGKKDRKKYSLLIFNSALLLWAILDFAFWVDTPSAQLGLTLQKVTSIIWIFIGVLFLNFVFELIKKKKNLIFYTSIVLSSILTPISLFTNAFIEGIKNESWGIVPVLGEWMIIAFVVVLFPLLYGVSLILAEYKNEKNFHLKKIYKNLVVGSLLAIVIISSTEVLLPLFLRVRIISLTSFGSASLSIFLIWIINKYHFLELSLEEVTKNIFERVNDGLVISNTKGEILMMNKSGEEFLEKTHADFLEMIHNKENDNKIIKSKFIDPITGKTKYHNISHSLFYDENKNPLNLYLLNDVTDLINFRNSLKDRNEELQITLYRISHDIKGPAAAINQLLEFTKNDRENIDLYIEKIEKSTKQLNKFIKEVEQLIRLKEAEPQKEIINLRENINRCWEELEYYKQHQKHQLKLNISDDLFKADSNLIYTILHNILSNAIKYHDCENKKENNITITSFVEKNILNLNIEDNGLGMDEITLGNLFKLFYRGNSTVSGSGLGMNLVKHCIDKAKGTILVDSKLGIGTKFSIKIPICPVRINPSVSSSALSLMH